MDKHRNLSGVAGIMKQLCKIFAIFVLLQLLQK